MGLNMNTIVLTRNLTTLSLLTFYFCYQAGKFGIFIAVDLSYVLDLENIPHFRPVPLNCHVRQCSLNMRKSFIFHFQYHEAWVH